MKAAWAAYRTARLARWAVGDEAGTRRFLPALFASSLRRAWEEARKAIKIAIAFLGAQQRVMTSKADAMAPGDRSARISAIRDELQVLDYAPLGVRAVNRRHDLSAELSILEHAAA